MTLPLASAVLQGWKPFVGVARSFQGRAGPRTMRDSSGFGEIPMQPNRLYSQTAFLTLIPPERPSPLMSADSSAIFDDSPVVRVRFRAQPDRLAPCRRRAHGALQLALRLRPGEARWATTGTFILRIEDTDRTRFVEGATEGILEILHWFGVDWDEGPDMGGPHGPYIQSERIDTLPASTPSELIDDGHAYRCFCTPERLQQVREEQQARGDAAGLRPPLPRDPATKSSPHELAAGEQHVVRFAMPREGETSVSTI